MSDASGESDTEQQPQQQKQQGGGAQQKNQQQQGQQQQQQGGNEQQQEQQQQNKPSTGRDYVKADKNDDTPGSAEQQAEMEKTHDLQGRTTAQEQKRKNAKKDQIRETQGESNRSRSASRRARRKRIEKDQRDGKYMHTNSLEALEEADADGELKEMQMFERIGPDSTSMDGPVTYARAMRGEIPMRGTAPKQPYKMDDGKKKGGLDDQDGLKLTVEANLDVELELKASIRGDLTLSL